MAAVLRKFSPVASSSPKKGHENGDETSDTNTFPIDYSFALEYDGPPISNVPQALPVEVDQIPIAQPVSFSSSLNDVPFPIIQPIINPERVIKNPSKELESGTGFYPDPDSSVVLMGHHVVSGSSSSSSSSPSSAGVDVLGADLNGHDKSYDTKSSSLLPSSSSPSSPSPSGSGRGRESYNDDVDDAARLPGSFKRIRSLNSYDEDRGLQDYRKPGSSMKEEDDGKAVNIGNGPRASVTFMEPHMSSSCSSRSSNEADEGHELSHDVDLPVTLKAERKGKKGTCYRCLMGNRFTEKEVCIVCDAKYCFNCVRRAMGAMPEGRKCVTCIGERIDESKRGSLGKCSRVLKRVLTDSEVKQIMNDEISCKTNQMPSRLIVVNRLPLSEEELFMLQTCPNPPKKLKPGRYWYDNVAGYWGKEGEKPCQIISPHMNIGGTIVKEASNGDTEILINNREITSTELMMLKMVGVQCEGRPHFWVNADGSYQEEGQNHVKGNIWDKKRARIACALLSLPIPQSIGIVESESPSYEQKLVHKLLLIGNEKCGTGTIYKQARSVYNVPFSEEESEKIKFTIQVNLYSYLATVLEAHERFEEQKVDETSENRSSMQIGESDSSKAISSISPRLKHFSDWLLKEKERGNLEIFPTSSRENAQTIADLWRDSSIQATFKRIRDTLPKNVVYFLEQIIEVSKSDYDPSNRDILHAEGLASSVGLSSVGFSFPETSHENSLDQEYRHDPNARYELIRLNPRSLGDNCKWLEMFEDSDMVIFCVAITDYDEYVEDGEDGVLKNKMMMHKHLFESIVTHPSLSDKRFVLFLTKYDELEQKMEKVPLKRCEWFGDFDPLISKGQSQSKSSRHNPPMAQRAFHYIASRFKRLYESLVSPYDGRSRRRRSYEPKLFVSQVTLESQSVDDALRYAREILKWHVEETCMFHEISTASLDASLSS